MINKKNSQNILRLTTPTSLALTTKLVTLTLVFTLLLSGCQLLGPNPKGLAKQTIDWIIDLGMGSGNPLKMPGLMVKAASLGAKVGKLSERDKQIYSEELGRLVGARAADLLEILRRDEAMGALLSSEGMGALLGSEGLGGLLGIEGLDILLTEEGLNALLSNAGGVQSGGSSSSGIVDSDRVVGGFLGGLFRSGSSSPTTVGESNAPEETKEKGGILGFLVGLFGGSKSGGALSGGKPSPLAANATHRQAMAKYDEIVAYMVKNPPPEFTTTLEIEMMEKSLNQYKGVLQLAGLAWSDRESRDGIIEVINNMIAELW